MNSRSVIFFTIGFWALALAGVTPVSAQGGAPDIPESAVSDGDKSVDSDGTDGTDDATNGGAANDGTTGTDGTGDADGATGTTDAAGGDTDDGTGGSNDGTDDGTGDAGANGATSDDSAGQGNTAPADGQSQNPDSEERDADAVTSKASGDKQALIQRDVVPTVIIFEGKNVRMRLGGLLQMHFAPYVGDESLLANDDIATSEGFRIRRARFGITGSFGKQFELQIVANPLESDPDVGTLSTARLSYQFLPGFFVNVGTDSVPFTRAELESSAFLAATERPLVARTIVPGRRLGVTVTGLVANRVGFIVGLMNGTQGYELGNRFGGNLAAARLQFNLVGSPNTRDPKDFGLAISGGGLIDNGPATRALAASADILLTAANASVKIEAMCDQTTPQDAPMPAPGIADDLTRCGAYAEFGYMLPMWKLQPMVRAEYFDDNTQIEDAGDSIMATVGVNAELRAFTRVQLHYTKRQERYGENRANDSVVMNLQGAF